MRFDPITRIFEVNVRELAEDDTFLLAVEDYLERTDRLH